MSFKPCLLLLSCFCLAACAHEEKVAVVEMQPHYVLQSQQGAEQVTMPGHVSRYQRQIIVAGSTIEPSSECAKNFGEVMDHLETLMKPQIEENNRIATQQAANPDYTF